MLALASGRSRSSSSSISSSAGRCCGLLPPPPMPCRLRWLLLLLRRWDVLENSHWASLFLFQTLGPPAFNVPHSRAKTSCLFQLNLKQRILAKHDVIPRRPNVKRFYLPLGETQVLVGENIKLSPSEKVWNKRSTDDDDFACAKPV